MRWSITPKLIFVVLVDGLHEQALDFRQGEGFFHKGVKFGFGQNLCQRCNAFNGCSTGDKMMCPLAPISLFVVGGAVLKALDFMLLLHKLPLECFLFGLQFFNFFFGHDFDLLTDKWIEKDRLRFR